MKFSGLLRQTWAGLRIMIVLTDPARHRLPAGGVGRSRRVPGLHSAAEGSIVTQNGQAGRVEPDRAQPGRPERQERPDQRPVLPHQGLGAGHGLLPPATTSASAPTTTPRRPRPTSARATRRWSSRSPRARRTSPSARGSARTRCRPTRSPRPAPASTRTSAPTTPTCRSPGRAGQRADRGPGASRSSRTPPAAAAGFLGEPGVNVLELNLAVQAVKALSLMKPRPRRRLSHVQPDEPPRRGELRIYLGAAPGVGKTFAMLGEARRRAERGTDVVVGLVETHGRDKTAELLDGLEVVPRKHAEPPRPRRSPRWTSTRSSPAQPEVVAGRRARAHQRARLAQREALAGRRGAARRRHRRAVHRQRAAPREPQRRGRADHRRRRSTRPCRTRSCAAPTRSSSSTSPPEALRRRLAHGNVYPARTHRRRAGQLLPRRQPDRAARAGAAVGRRPGRRRACSATAPSTHITDTWEARERVVVALTGGPESETLIRRAPRGSPPRAGAELLAVHVAARRRAGRRRPAAAGRASASWPRTLGAHLPQVVGDDVPTALLDFARGVNATQLVLGTSRRSRWRAAVRARASAPRVISQSGPIDVHMVTHAQAERGPAAAGRPAARSRRCGRSLGWVLGARCCPALVTGGGALPGTSRSASPPTRLVFVLATVVVALVGGLGPALLSALLGAVLLNYFFVPPPARSPSPSRRTWSR